METIDTTTAGVPRARQRVLPKVGEAEIKLCGCWFTDLSAAQELRDHALNGAGIRHSTTGWASTGRR
jgi:hypothetical protein